MLVVHLSHAGGSTVTKPIFSNSGKPHCLTRPVQKGRRQEAYESFCVSLHGMIHEAQLLAMFVWAVHRGFA